MKTSQITLQTVDGGMPTYSAAPDSATRGGIVVIQEAFGVTSHIEDICRRLADAGWLAIAPALFHRQGSPVLGYDDYDSVMPVMQELSSATITEDLRAAFDHLEQQGYPARRSGIVGFCMGGTVAFYAATQRPLGASVTYYGGGIEQGRFGFPPQLEVASSLQAAWLGLYGDLDQSIPVEHVEQLRIEAGKAAVKTEIVRYANAQHGFNCNDRLQVFNAEVAADAWRRTLSWFEEHIAQG